MKNESKILAWFLGPKAENEPIFEEMILLVLRDYAHWRRNYFPSDNILVTRSVQRDLEEQYDKFYQKLIEMTAELRRNFPFYSPRYIGHMLSDTLMPSIVGYFSGMLYNPNNVTPEAAPVTVDMEIDACNEVLSMVGFNKPPDIPKILDKKTIDDYKKRLQGIFGWAHITSGGTTANIEALWVARTVKYMPLSIWDTARENNLSIEIKLPNGESKDIKRLSKLQILSIKSNEAIYLLAKYIEAYRLKNKIKIEEASNEALKQLNKSKYSLNKGFGKIFEEFPPVIFVSGAAHYSITKAVDLLGIGRENIETIISDTSFRMDVEYLEKKLDHIHATRKRIPLAVIVIAGTTEEGAIDPIAKISDLRKKIEIDQNYSFWIHVDSAWGGFLRSLFNITENDEVLSIINKTSNTLNIEPEMDLSIWHEKVFSLFEEKMEKPQNEVISQDMSETLEKSKLRLINHKEKLSNFIHQNNFKDYFRGLKKVISEFQEFNLAPTNTSFRLTLSERMSLIQDFVQDTITIEYKNYTRDISIRWGVNNVCESLAAIPLADSITIDPHKMGYVTYPCGVVAYKNDRIRHFIKLEAPYITSVRQDVLIHMPPKHFKDIDTDSKIIVESFGPYIIEGSRPGAAATSLWLAMKTVPPTMKEAGMIVRSSLLAARELYEWIIHWDKICQKNMDDIDYQFIPMNSSPPDTNLIVFAIKKRTSNSIEKMNKLTELVYKKFSIQSELGEREYSYSQPFFISKTPFTEPNYNAEVIKSIIGNFFDNTHNEQLIEDYKTYGITVLRATVMNPYISLMENITGQRILKDFVLELANTAKEAVKEIE